MKNESGHSVSAKVSTLSLVVIPQGEAPKLRRSGVKRKIALSHRTSPASCNLTNRHLRNRSHIFSLPFRYLISSSRRNQASRCPITTRPAKKNTGESCSFPSAFGFAFATQISYRGLLPIHHCDPARISTCIREWDISPLASLADDACDDYRVPHVPCNLVGICSSHDFVRRHFCANIDLDYDLLFSYDSPSRFASRLAVPIVLLPLLLLLLLLLLFLLSCLSE